MNVADSRCLVVGGARRLGRQLAADLVRSGARVALSSRSEEDAVRTAAALGGSPRVIGVAGDTAGAEGARTVVAQAARALDGLDALVYVASGAFTPGPPQTIDEAAWDVSLDVIAKGFFFSACAAHEVMAAAGEAAAESDAGALVESRGAIVAITDLLGLQAWAAFAAHGAAKAAQIQLVKILARAWATQGVRVCGVAPGPVDLADDERREATRRAAARGASGRLVTPEEIASGVRFCLENEAVTGVNVIVDGGALVTF
jgi:NAD(P)-dependent dehydrogenase (short-subunit alcohol dehydrogenase family)